MSSENEGATPALDAATGRAGTLEQQLIEQASQDPAFRERLVNDPKAVFAEQGLAIPEDIQVKVLEESPSTYYLILPALQTAQTKSGELSDADLENIAGGHVSVATQWTGCASGHSGCIVTMDPGYCLETSDVYTKHGTCVTVSAG